MYLTRSKLLQMCFHHVGENVLISDKCSIYKPENISIGDNVRIDDFCILSASEEIIIGNWVHIACYTSLIGSEMIMIKDFAGVSMRCTILSSNADYSGYYMTNPHLPEKYLNTLSAPVVLDKHSLIGAGSMILPGVSIGEGAVVGAMSLVKKSIGEYEVWAGVPAKYLHDRERKVRQLEKQMKHENSKH
jgi:acetyltransferase-like isoleucine patch superfamily enzyme